MRVVIEKQARKTLRKMPQKIAVLILDKVERFAQNQKTVHADIKKMAGTHNSFRLRQGDWRVILVKTDEAIIIEAIATRGDIYK